ncbi:MAG TPA: ATP-binding protein [Caulobacteraceae bacterium]|jgi:signal transduction histidine kinase|nr:ATP-binding protein [Caulobacteraceae bacterium]
MSSTEAASGGLWRRLREAGAAAFEIMFSRKALARAEADARLAEERLRAALDALPEGIVFLDTEGRYVLWNARYAEIYHRSADLFAPGAKLADTLRIGVARGDYPEAVGREEAWLAQRLALMASPGQRHEQRLADGRWLMIEERRTRDGGLIGLRVDITAMKAQAAALSEALARAEAASRAKSEFLANMSHELRTPLNGVLGLAQVLAGTGLDDAQRRLLADLAASAGSLNVLLADILDFNTLEAGRLQISRAPFDLAALAAESIEPFLVAARSKGLELKLNIAEGVAGAVVGDTARVRQILSNLISNAVKFTPAGFVEVALATVFGAETETYRITVSDTGVGFDAADAERLFARFEQGDASATREHGGLGLGLAICRQLAELMGGEITAHGRPGEGASFSVTLPLPRAPEDMGERALRVLLADDNATNRKVVEMMLEAVGAQVVSVENGRAAVDALAAGGFDAVLMDLQMPVMDGLTAIRLIRAAEARSAGPRLPIIVLSANASADDVAASSAAGADAHLGKPIQADALLTVLAGTAVQPTA